MQGAIIKISKLLPLIAAQDVGFGEFCEKAGLSRRFQYLIRNGKPIRNLEVVIKIGKALGLEGEEQYEKVFEWREEGNKEAEQSDPKEDQDG